MNKVLERIAKINPMYVKYWIEYFYDKQHFSIKKYYNFKKKFKYWYIKFNNNLITKKNRKGYIKFLEKISKLGMGISDYKKIELLKLV